MDIEITAATERAIKEAWSWCLDDSGALLQAPAVLLGLLSEPECRASVLLEAYGVDAAAIRAHWPSLQRKTTSNRATPSSFSNEGVPDGLVPRFSPEIEAAVAIARDWLADLPHPLTLATEHLLMGLVASEHAVGCWLRQHNLSAEVLRDEILKRYGLAKSPLEIDAVTPATIDLSEGEVSAQAVINNTVTSRSPVSSQSVEVPKPRSEDANVVRLLDASANRAREALRVIEDYVRFVLDDRHLTERLKLLRHGLTSALAKVSMPNRLAMRDTQADVGTSVSTETERARDDAVEVLTANFTRLQEALRSLEEFGKIGNSWSSQLIEQLRYDTYTLHKAVHGTVEGLARLGGACLYVLVDGRSSVDTFEELVLSLVEAGVDIIQLRDKTLGDRELLDRARRLRHVTASNRTLFVMNDRPDLAVLAAADGVHVGQEELTLHDVRQIVGPRMLVGVSTHSLEQARKAVLDGASYLGVGPTFASGTKAFPEFPGLEFAKSVAAEIRLPAFAIGGIDTENVTEVLATGIGRVAVSGAIISASDPVAAARRFLKQLQAAPMILHVDMDAFYASVEQRDRPELKGRPVIVGGSPQGRGVVSAASYEARRYGVHSAMPAVTAVRQCPHAVLLPPRIDHYARISRQIHEIFERYTPLVEPLSLDEAFLDVRGSIGLFGPPVEIARQIKATIREELDLVASVGVAPNKFLAKVASDLEKPDGLVIVDKGREQAFLDPLPVGRLWGVGRVAGRAFEQLGIRTIGQLRRMPLDVLASKFGSVGEPLWNLAHGRDDRSVVPEHQAKSISHETTFERDIHDREVLHAWLLDLTDQVARRLRAHRLKGRTVQLKVRYSDFRTITRSQSLPEPTDVTDEIWRVVIELFEQRLPLRLPPVRLLGMGVTGLDQSGERQTLLFDAQQRERQGRLDSATDKIRQRFGSDAIGRAAVIQREKKGKT